MKKIFVTITIFCLFFRCFGQSEDSVEVNSVEINIDMLKSPSSSAANLVGIAPKEIQKPTDFRGFLVSVQSATNGFSSLPNSFAIDVDPMYFKSKKLTDFLNQKPNLFLSAAVTGINRQKEKKDTLKVGFGMKLSLIKGKIKPETTKEFERIFHGAKELNLARIKKMDGAGLDSIVENNDEIKKIKVERDRLSRIQNPSKTDQDSLKTIEDLISSKIDILRAPFEKTFLENKKTIIDELQKSANNLKIERYGSKLDISGGIVYYFPNEVFANNRDVNKKFGIWATYEYEPKNYNLSILSILRYQYNPDKIFALDNANKLKDQTVNSIDWGGSIEYEVSKFTISGEAIYRWAMMKSNIVVNTPNSWRIVFNANYEIDKNTALTFSFGRNFDKSVKTDGNVIAALNFIKGFGKRKIAF